MVAVFFSFRLSMASSKKGSYKIESDMQVKSCLMFGATKNQQINGEKTHIVYVEWQEMNELWMNVSSLESNKTTTFLLS